MGNLLKKWKIPRSHPIFIFVICKCVLMLVARIYCSPDTVVKAHTQLHLIFGNLGRYVQDGHPFVLEDRSYACLMMCDTIYTFNSCWFSPEFR